MKSCGDIQPYVWVLLSGRVVRLKDNRDGNEDDSDNDRKRDDRDDSDNKSVR